MKKWHYRVVDTNDNSIVITSENVIMPLRDGRTIPFEGYFTEDMAKETVDSFKVAVGNDLDRYDFEVYPTDKTL